MKYRKFDLVLALFPFTDLSESKKRPALVLKDLEGVNNVLCLITTKSRNFKRYEIDLKKENCEGDIRFNSKIYVDVLFTLHDDLIIKKIGVVKDQNVKKQIQEKISKFFLE